MKKTISKKQLETTKTSSKIKCHMGACKMGECSVNSVRRTAFSAAPVNFGTPRAAHWGAPGKPVKRVESHGVFQVRGRKEGLDRLWGGGGALVLGGGGRRATG